MCGPEEKRRPAVPEPGAYSPEKHVVTPLEQRVVEHVRAYYAGEARNQIVEINSTPGMGATWLANRLRDVLPPETLVIDGHPDFYQTGLILDGENRPAAVFFSQQEMPPEVHGPQENARASLRTAFEARAANTLIEHLPLTASEVEELITKAYPHPELAKRATQIHRWSGGMPAIAAAISQEMAQNPGLSAPEALAKHAPTLFEELTAPFVAEFASEPEQQRVAQYFLRHAAATGVADSESLLVSAPEVKIYQAIKAATTSSSAHHLTVWEESKGRRFRDGAGQALLSLSLVMNPEEVVFYQGSFLQGLAVEQEQVQEPGILDGYLIRTAAWNAQELEPRTRELAIAITGK